MPDFRALSAAVSLRLSGRCVCCNGNSIERYRSPEQYAPDFRFYRCRSCSFIFVWPIPDNLASYYGEATAPDFGTGEEEWNRIYLNAIESYHPLRGNLLEIGFGDGSFLAMAEQSGWSVYGTELSAPLVEHARTILNGADVRLAAIEDAGFSDAFFDVIAGFNFLEHVPDPRRTLTTIHRLLKPGGVVAVMCPNISGVFHKLMPEILGQNDPLKISWCPPFHLSYFDKKNLPLLLERQGFAEIQDHSAGLSCLWRQFEPTLGPEITIEKLRKLVKESPESAEVKRVIVERMTWSLLSDLQLIEPELKSEVGMLFLAKKPDA